MEQRGCNLLSCCIVGLSLDDGVRDEKVFTKDSERLIESVIPVVLNQGPIEALLSDDHSSVDGTLIEAWASMKSFRHKNGSGKLPGTAAIAAPAKAGGRAALSR